MKINSENIGVFTMPYWYHTLEYALDSISSSGFKSIELWGVSPQYCYADYNEEERKARKAEILKMLSDRGLKLPVFYPEQTRQYTINIASPDDNIRDWSIKVMKEYIEDTADFGASTMVLSSGWQYIDSPSDENYVRAVDAAKILADKAKELGVTLALEILGASGGAIVKDVNEQKKFIDDVASDALKPCLDIPQIYDMGMSIGDYFKLYDGKIGHIRFGDGGYKVPGIGYMDVAAYLHELEKYDYSGMLSFEYLCYDCFLNPDEGIMKSAEWFRRNGFMA